ncbi:hypothetical protein L1987_49343 [Smallanthus sonchifolius]|uniref:Uncharacterized protein n=1 Tax=Smallanthus sonchifolius TaxID=185202 RepID=A0ACB9FVD7_9ASTR|nr:hypothetical protein L1987_49343 [Smallanthus sonchifolius]
MEDKAGWPNEIFDDYKPDCTLETKAKTNCSHITSPNALFAFRRLKDKQIGHDSMPVIPDLLYALKF